MGLRWVPDKNKHPEVPTNMGFPPPEGSAHTVFSPLLRILQVSAQVSISQGQSPAPSLGTARDWSVGRFKGPSPQFGLTLNGRPSSSEKTFPPPATNQVRSAVPHMWASCVFHSKPSSHFVNILFLLFSTSHVPGVLSALTVNMRHSPCSGQGGT